MVNELSIPSLLRITIYQYYLSILFYIAILHYYSVLMINNPG